MDVNCCNACSDQSDISAVPLWAASYWVLTLPVRQTLRPNKGPSMLSRLSRRQFGLASLALGSSLLARTSAGQGYRTYPPVIPGTGIRVARTGDDFEAEDWVYYPQHPKSSSE